MKIRSVDAIPIRVPRLTAMIAAQGSIAESEFGLVRIESDEGQVGWGEISMSWGRVGRSLCRDVGSQLGPAIVGRDPRDIQGALLAMDRVFDMATDGGHAAKAGIELALFDLTGKALGVPVYRLLGGRAREAVPVAWPIPWGSIEDTVARAREAVERGFQSVKLKIGRPGRVDQQVVAAVRKNLGEAPNIKVDANMAYRSAGEALAALHPLEQFRLQLIEQPLAARDLDELARLRDRLITPLLLDESCWELRDIGEIVRRGAADVLNIYVSEMGGLLKTVRAFGAAEAAGLQALLGSQCELGIGTAAAAHVGVAVPNLAYESDVVGVLRYPRDVVSDPPRIAKGMLHVPEKPGLGVTVDEEAVDNFRLDL